VVSYLYRSGILLKDLQRLGKALSEKLAKVDLDVMKVEIRDVMAQ
jgi:hypothetical protein